MDLARMKRFILIEDSVIWQEAMAEAVALLPWSATMMILSNGYDAMRYFKMAQSKPDLMLVDLGLPDISGIDVITSARTAFPEISALVISSLKSRDQVVTAIRAGASGYIIKDDTSIAIATAIQQVLEGNYPISPEIARYLVELSVSRKSGEGRAIPSLSKQELRLLELIGKGHSYAQCAHIMELQLSTVQTYSKNLYRKLNVHSQSQAAAAAYELGLFE